MGMAGVLKLLNWPRNKSSEATLHNLSRNGSTDLGPNSQKYEHVGHSHSNQCSLLFFFSDFQSIQPLTVFNTNSR